MEVRVDLCATCPRRKISNPSKAAGHLLLESYFARDNLERRAGIGSFIKLMGMDQQEVDAVTACLSNQLSGECEWSKQESPENLQEKLRDK